MKNLNSKISQMVKTELSDFYSVGKFREDKAKQKSTRNDKRYVNRILRKEGLKLELDYLQLAIDKNDQFSSSLNAYLMKNARKAGRIKKHEKAELKDFMLIHIIISNNYTAIKQAFKNGMNYQALVLFRNTIELTELAIGILGDEELHRFYRKTIQKNGIEDFQNIKFMRTKTKTDKIIIKIKDVQGNNINPDLWEGYLDIRNNLYNKASRFSHSNFSSIYTNAYITPLSSKFYDFKDLVMPNIGGIINATTKKNITEVIVYELLSSMIFSILLIDRHKLPYIYFKDDAYYNMALFKANWDLIGEFLVSVGYDPQLSRSTN